MLFEAPNGDHLVMLGDVLEGDIDKIRGASQDQHHSPFRNGHRMEYWYIAIRQSPSLGHDQFSQYPKQLNTITAHSFAHWRAMVRAIAPIY